MEYFTTHPGFEVWPDEGKMTIGVGVICDHGESVVLTGDTRATYGSTPIGPNDNCGKVFRLSKFPTMACVAGGLSSCHAVISELTAQIAKLKTEPFISREHMMQAIDASRFRELRKIYNTAMETSWGISLHDFVRGKIKHGKINEMLLKAGRALLDSTPLRVELIVGGFIGDQTMFFRASNKLPLQEESSPGVYAIGTGAIAAMGHLNTRGQGHAMSLARSMLHVHEAMLAARKADPDHIGTTQAYFVMRKRYPEVLFLRANAPILESWRKAYEARKTTASLDDSTIPSRDVYNQLKVYPLSADRFNRQIK